MIDSYVPSPIPFYISNKRSDWRRSSCRDIPPYPQPVIAVADFSINIANGIDIRVESDPGPVTSVFLLPWGGGDSIILDEGAFDVAATTDGAYSIYLQPTTFSAPGIELDVHYYLIVEAGGQAYESECIYTRDVTEADFPKDCNDDRISYIKVSWSSECGINGGGAAETGGYMMYIDGEVGRPEWSPVEEGEEDAEGQEVVDYQRIRKRMSITFPGTLYIADALTHTLLFDTRTIEFDDGLVWNFRDPKVDVVWDETGCESFCMLTFSFEIDGLSRFGCASECAE